ncbi:N-formylglutamate deformylase [Candidatus Rhodobacter oscarellae]|uniref:N-formylglutamate deformylase n=1 Tax=Candidatus Rhodobacter oscarellae TaxID=1675527 RepID=A0A0J9EG83_9RHOB|nr:alpha/beta hydrolase [Candidatus Rhodobacter lobularis]KMW60674.1 N-formylglutamate deformylase [Candidatus Rhodobacter lobularis]
MIAAGVEYEAVGSGAPVVCLHGIGGGVESFRAQMDALGGEDWRVISWNMPGYGTSTPEDLPWSFGGLSDRLGAFIAELGHARAHLVGQSIGGMLALEHALRRPEQVASLSLIGTTPAFGGRDDSFKDAFLKARLAPLEAGLSMAEMAAQAAPHLVGPNAPGGVGDEIAGIMSAVPEATWRAILDCLVTFNRRDDLGRVAAPCCLIAGSHDQNAPARTMQKMAAKLPDAEYHLIDGAGHMINQEFPCETNAILRRFLTAQ